MSLRTTALTGAGLVALTAVLLLLDGVLELELTPVLLAGVATGAVLGLATGSVALLRAAGFVAGVLLAWAGFVVRAGVLPDTAMGRAVVVELVLVLCVALALVTLGHVPLWTPLLGVAALAGVYETTFADAPSEVLATSLTAVTSLLLASACGFLAVVALSPVEGGRRPRAAHRERPTHNDPILEDVA